MKQNFQVPIDISRLPICFEQPTAAKSGKYCARLPSSVRAAHIRKNAKIILDLPGRDCRLRLILAQIAVIALSLAVPLILDCLSLLIYALPYVTDGKIPVWLLILRGILWGANILLVVLPLLAGLYRMAVLSVQRSGEPPQTSGENFVDFGVWEFLHPFTSLRAYTCTLYVGIRVLFRTILILLPSAVIMLSVIWGIPILGHSCPAVLTAVLWVLAIALSCLSLWGMTVWGARSAGLAYFVFAYPERNLWEITTAFKRFSRDAATPLWMRLSLLGWFLLSALAVLVPLLLHTVPYILLSEAVYGQSLEIENADFFKIQEENQP